jgi:NTE family protein
MTKALVLSGGGSKGAAEVGVLDYLLEQNLDLEYDIFAGVSVGALNCALLAESPLKESIPKLKNIWLNKVKGNSSVWHHHLWNHILICIIIILIFSLLALGTFLLSMPKWLTITFFLMAVASFYLPYMALNNTHSIYKNDPLKHLITSNLNIKKLKESSKKLVVGTVSFTTGEYKSVREVDDKIIDWIMASSAFPIFFPMSFINNEYWTDGGVVNIAPLTDVLDMGADDIDVIITSPLSAGTFNGTAGLIKQLMRNIDIISSKILQDDVMVKTAIYGGIKIRFFIFDKQLTSNSLDFAPSKLKNMFEEGRKLAKKVAG